MSHYHEILKQIKENDANEFLVLDHKQGKISLRIVNDHEKNVIKLLSKWRKIYRNMFGTVFEVSEKRTKVWIKKDILDNPNCILFLIYVNEKMVGNVGIDNYDEKSNSVELENYMKDPEFDFPGLMTIIERPFLKWIFEGLKVSKITTHIFSDNYKMLNIHARCGGWKTTDAIPLKRVITSDGWKWEKVRLKKDELGERYYHRLEITREKFLKFNKDVKYKIAF